MQGGTPAIAAVLLLGFCGGDPEVTPQFNPTLAPLAQRDRLYYDDSGGIQDSLQMVITDPVTWRDVWSEATSRRGTPPQQPQIDFAESAVIVVGWGRRDPEDRIRVDSVGVHEQLTPAGDRERVFKVIVRRVQGCAGFTADVYPLEIVRVPRIEHPVAFEWRPIQRSPDCGDVEVSVRPAAPDPASGSSPVRARAGPRGRATEGPAARRVREARRRLTPMDETAGRSGRPG